MSYTTPDPKEIELSKKELLLMRLSQHIEQAQVDSPAYCLSNLAQKGSEELIQEFLSDQPSVDTSTVENFVQSQLYVSCFWGLYDIVKILIDNKADVNYTNPRTLWTPLHAATFQDNGRIVMLLLEHGADPLSEDYRGRTPADFASASDKIWSHFDVLNISRTTKVSLINKRILPGAPESAKSVPRNSEERTESGIKLVSYPSVSSRSGSSLTSISSLPSTASTALGSQYRFTSPPTTSRTSLSGSNRMRDIINGDITVESPISTGRRRSYQSQKSSSSMSSVLSWD